MPTIADLNALRGNPQVAYPEYGEIRAEVRAMSQLVHPIELGNIGQVARRRGLDWCQSVVGFDWNGSLRDISVADARMLLVADRRGLEPPLPPWLAEWKAESAAHHARIEEAAATLARAGVARYAAAVKSMASGVHISPRPNVNSQVRHGRRVHLVHAAALYTLLSGTERSPRRHEAGAALCETGQAQALQLGEPCDDPVTCVRCLDWMSKVRAAA